MSYHKGRPMDFLGAYPCFLCGTRVRVYGWLPECVLCPKHERERDQEEASMEEKR